MAQQSKIFEFKEKKGKKRKTFSRANLIYIYKLNISAFFAVAMTGFFKTVNL